MLDQLSFRLSDRHHALHCTSMGPQQNPEVWSQTDQRFSKYAKNSHTQIPSFKMMLLQVHQIWPNGTKFVITHIIPTRPSNMVAIVQQLSGVMKKT